MQYLLTDEELAKVRKDARLSGFQEAERTLGEVLGGHRQLFVGIERSDPLDRRPNYEALPENSVWNRLIATLDKK